MLGIELPITISVGAGEVGLLAKLDTGAASCIFQREHAEALALDVESGEPKRFETARGSFATYGHTVRLSSCNFDLDSMVYFARDYEFPRNVLGLQGWFDKLRFGLVHYDELLFLSRYDD